MDKIELENIKNKEFVTSKELALILGISVKTITNNSHKIIGRCKIGGSVRFNLPKVLYQLQQGKNLFGGNK